MDNTASSTHEGCSTPKATTSTTELLALIDWAALPAETQQTIRTLGPLMQEGCSQSEMARRLRLPESKVAALRRDLAAAIVDQCRQRADELEPKLRALVERLHAA